jgi:small GTP-binding protein
MCEKEALFSSYTVVVCGDTGVGKSSLIARMAKDQFEEGQGSAVTGSMIPMSVDVDGKRIKLMIWDTSGSEECRDLTNCHFENAQACLMVYAVDDPQSAENILSTWRILLEKHSKVPHIAMVIGNKVDLGEDQRKVHEEWNKKMIDDISIPVKAVSCLDGSGIKEIVKSLASNLIQVFPPSEAAGNKQQVAERLSVPGDQVWKCSCVLL